MKRYWLFVYSQYYPNGGMNDFFGSYDTTEEAKEVALQNLDSGGWFYHVYDSIELKISLASTDDTRHGEVQEATNISVEQLQKSNWYD